MPAAFDECCNWTSFFRSDRHIYPAIYSSIYSSIHLLRQSACLLVIFESYVLLFYILLCYPAILPSCKVANIIGVCLSIWEKHSPRYKYTHKHRFFSPVSVKWVTCDLWPLSYYPAANVLRNLFLYKGRN